MMDWLKATAAAFTAVTILVALFIAFIYRFDGHLEPREPDDVQDYLSPDGIISPRLKRRLAAIWWVGIAYPF